MCARSPKALDSKFIRPSEVAKLSTISVNPPEDLAGSSEAEVW